MGKDRLLLLILGLLLAALVALGLMRVLPAGRAAFARWAGERLTGLLDTPVSFRAIGLSWDGAIQVTDLTIGDPLDPARPFFSAPQVRVGLDPARVLTGGIALTRVEIVGARIRIRRYPDGRWTVTSFRSRHPRRPSGGPSRLRLRIGELVLTDSRTVILGALADSVVNRMDFRGSLEVTGPRQVIEMRTADLWTSFASLGALRARGELTIADGALGFEEFRAEQGRSWFEGEGRITVRGEDRVAFTVTKGSVDLGALPEGVRQRAGLQGMMALEGVRLQGRLVSPTVEARVRIPEGTAFRYAYTDLAASVRRHDGRIEIPEFRAALLGGRASGSAQFDLRPRTDTYRAEVDLQGIDIAQLPYTIPARLHSSLSGHVSFAGEGFSARDFRAHARCDLGEGVLAAIPLQEVSATAALTAQGVEIEESHAVLRGAGHGTFSGWVGARDLSLQVEAQRVDLTTIEPLSPLRGATGAVSFRGRVEGEYRDPAVAGEVTWERGEYRGIGVSQAAGEVDLAGLRTVVTGEVQGRGEGVRTGGIRLRSVEGRVRIQAGAVQVPSLFVSLDTLTFLDVAGEVTLAGGRPEGIALERASLFYRGGRIGLGEPVAIAWGGEGWRVEGARIPFAQGEVRIGGEWGSGGEVRARLEADGLDLYRVSRFLDLQRPLEGHLTGTLEATGRPEDPVLRAEARIAGPGAPGMRADSLRVRMRYQGERILLEEAVLAQGASRSTASLEIPASLSLRAPLPRLLEGPLRGHVEARGVPLQVLHLLTDRVRVSSGTIDMVADVGGTARRPNWQGHAAFLGGAGVVLPTNTAIQDLQGMLVFEGGKARLEGIEARTPEGSVALDGTVTLEGLLPTDLDVTVRLANWGVHQVGYISDLYLDGEIAVIGSPHHPHATGLISVRSGIVSPPLEGRAGEVVTRAPLPLDFALNVRGEGDLWIRTRQGSAEVSVDLQVSGEGSEIETTGDVEILRGTYSQYGWEFTIEEGTIHFFGGPRINPALDIWASRVIRGRLYLDGATEDDENTVRLRIAGTYESPEITLTVLDRDGQPLGLERRDAIALIITDQTWLQYRARTLNYQETVRDQAGRILAEEALRPLQPPRGRIQFNPGFGESRPQVSWGQSLGKGLYVLYSQDLLDPGANTIGVEVSLRRRMVLLGQTDSEGRQFSIDFRYRIRY